MDAALRRLKEAFVTDHKGTSDTEIALVVSLPLLFTALHQGLHLERVSATHPWLGFLVDTATLTLPTLAVICQPEHNATYANWAAAVALPLLALRWYQTAPRTGARAPAALKGKGAVAHAYAAAAASQAQSFFWNITRGGLQLMTMICILAVDFPVFPRRFAKTETFGTGLMDVGIGCFVVSSALTSGPYLLGRPSAKTMQRVTRGSTIVLFLGLARTLLTKSVNYQEHVSEYGLHWNFFTTLGLVPFVLAALRFLVPIHGFAAGIAMTLAHQFCYQNGLEDWVLHAPRQSFVSANKEGIASLPGYFALFLLGAHLATTSLRAQPRPLLALAVFYGTAYRFSLSISGTAVSRRLANTPYVLWVMATTTVYIAASRLICGACGASRVPRLFEAINANQLVVFVVANLLTGLINLSMDTLRVSDDHAMAILAAYLVVVTGVGYVLHAYRLRIH